MSRLLITETDCRAGSGPYFPDFPRHGKFSVGFSTPWKTFFHTVENPGNIPKSESVSSVLLSTNFLLFMHGFRSNTLPTYKLRCSFYGQAKRKPSWPPKTPKDTKTTSHWLLISIQGSPFCGFSCFLWPCFFGCGSAPLYYLATNSFSGLLLTCHVFLLFPVFLLIPLSIFMSS